MTAGCPFQFISLAILFSLLLLRPANAVSSRNYPRLSKRRPAHCSGTKHIHSKYVAFIGSETGHFYMRALRVEDTQSYNDDDDINRGSESCKSVRFHRPHPSFKMESDSLLHRLCPTPKTISASESSQWDNSLRPTTPAVLTMMTTALPETTARIWYGYVVQFGRGLVMAWMSVKVFGELAYSGARGRTNGGCCGFGS